jgi:hypothetical protein
MRVRETPRRLFDIHGYGLGENVSITFDGDTMGKVFSHENRDEEALPDREFLVDILT